MSGSPVDPSPVILFAKLETDTWGSLPLRVCPPPYMEPTQGFQAWGWPLARALLLSGSCPLIFVSPAPCRILSETFSGCLFCVSTFAFKLAKPRGKTSPWCQICFFTLPFCLGAWPLKSCFLPAALIPSLITPGFLRSFFATVLVLCFPASCPVLRPQGKSATKNIGLISFLIPSPFQFFVKTFFVCLSFWLL